jgi:hypothetical protein
MAIAANTGGLAPTRRSHLPLPFGPGNTYRHAHAMHDPIARLIRYPTLSGSHRQAQVYFSGDAYVRMRAHGLREELHLQEELHLHLHPPPLHLECVR